MILSAREIAKRINQERPERRLVIRPYSEECQQPASYDLMVAEDVLLERGACMLVATQEWVELPCDLAGTMRCRSSFARRGVLLGGGFIDPGFRGQLTISLTDMGKEEILLKKNDRVVQMIIHEVAGGDRLYNGRYQDSTGAVRAR
jgi:dCTP deaminase